MASVQSQPQPNTPAGWQAYATDPTFGLDTLPYGNYRQNANGVVGIEQHGYETRLTQPKGPST
jgi:hypothetical protein